MPITLGAARLVLTALPALTMIPPAQRRGIGSASGALAIPVTLTVSVSMAVPSAIAVTGALPGGRYRAVPGGRSGAGSLGGRHDGGRDGTCRFPLSHRTRDRLLLGARDRARGMTAGRAGAVMVRRRHRGRGRRGGRGDLARDGREPDDADQHDDDEGGHRDAGVGDDRATPERARGLRLAGRVRP